MIQFKACPKCQGDLMLDYDELKCLQCGFVKAYVKR